MERHQPQHQLGVLISVWFYQTLSLWSLAVWNKGSSVRNAESFFDWTASMYAHGSHGKKKDKLRCSLLELGPPRCFSLGFYFHPSFCGCLSFTQTNVGAIWSDGLNYGLLQNWSISVPLVFSFCSHGNSVFDPHYFSSVISYIDHPSTPSTHPKLSLYILPISTQTSRLGLSPVSPPKPPWSTQLTTSPVLLDHLRCVTHLAFIIDCQTLVFSDSMHLSHL